VVTSAAKLRNIEKDKPKFVEKDLQDEEQQEAAAATK